MTGGAAPVRPSAPGAPPPSGAAGGTPAPGGVVSTRKRSWWERSHAALLALVVVAGLGYYLASWWRLQEFYATNWDLGINMQALWSTTHGYVLYEAGDFETTGLKSLLSVHSTYVAIPVAYLYALAPSAETLFALQAAVVVSSAIPLYLIGRRAGLPESWLVAGLAVYLLTFALSSAILYDFHWESFLPAEFAWTYYLWARRRYALAFVPAAIGVLTLEVFPFLLVGLVLCFSYPAFRRLLAGPSATAPTTRSSLRSYLTRAGPLLALLAFALASYVVLRVLQHDVIPGIVGTTPSSLGSQVSLGYQQLFGIRATSQTILPSLVYWFLLFAAFGFLPLLVRQSVLLLSLPWFWASVFIDPSYSAAFGNQYAFVALATVAVAFIEALAAVHRSVQANDTKAPLPLEWLLVVVPFFLIAVLYSTQLLRPTREGEYLLVIAAVVVVAVLALILLSRSRAPGWSKTVWRRTYQIRDSDARISYRQSTRYVSRTPRAVRPPLLVGLTPYRPRAGAVLAGVLGLIVLANVALSPFAPANFQATVYPGYRFSTAGNPAYGDMGTLLADLPANATLVASDNLFPFVANDVHAYSLLFASTSGAPHLPFNSADLPNYVLLSISEWSAVPAFLQSAVFDPTDYGIPAVIYDPSYPDTIYLFALGYQGETTVLQASPFANTTLLCPSAFALGASGKMVEASGTMCGSEIESVPAANLSGNGHTVWFGPYITLLPGQYTVTMSLKGGLASGKAAKTQVVLLNGGGYGVTPPWYSFNLNGTQLLPDAWTTVTVHVNVTWAVSGSEFRGYLDYPGATPQTANGFIDLNYMEISRTAAPP